MPQNFVTVCASLTRSGWSRAGHYHSQMKRTEDRFVSYWNKKRHVSSLANRYLTCTQRRPSHYDSLKHSDRRSTKAWSWAATPSTDSSQPLETKSSGKGWTYNFSPVIYFYLYFSIIVKNLNKGDKKPTFQQFLTHIAMNGPATYNRHWKPNWLICNPCKFHYDYIVKMETFSRDSGAVLRQVNSDYVFLRKNHFVLKIGAAELADINHLNGRGRSDRPPLDYERLLKSVPAHILAKILEIFHLDFVLFGYDKTQIVKIVEKKKRETEKQDIAK